MFGWIGLLKDSKYIGGCMDELIAYSSVSRVQAKDFITSYIPLLMELKENKKTPIYAVSLTCLILLTHQNRITNMDHIEVILKFSASMIHTNPGTKISIELQDALDKIANNELSKEIEKYSSMYLNNNKVA